MKCIGFYFSLSLTHLNTHSSKLAHTGQWEMSVHCRKAKHTITTIENLFFLFCFKDLAQSWFFFSNQLLPDRCCVQTSNDLCSRNTFSTGSSENCRFLIFEKNFMTYKKELMNTFCWKNCIYTHFNVKTLFDKTKLRKRRKVIVLYKKRQPSMVSDRIFSVIILCRFLCFFFWMVYRRFLSFLLLVLWWREKNMKSEKQ